MTMSMSKLVLTALVATLTVSGCATAEFARKPTAPGRGLIYVYRPSNMLGAFISGAVVLNGPGGFSRSFPLRNDKYVATEVPAGTYTLNVAGAWGNPIAVNMPINVSDGSASFVRCVFHKKCEQLDESQGGPEVASCKENVAGD
jgi:hypothetical protein